MAHVSAVFWLLLDRAEHIKAGVLVDVASLVPVDAGVGVQRVEVELLGDEGRVLLIMNSEAV